MLRRPVIQSVAIFRVPFIIAFAILSFRNAPNGAVAQSSNAPQSLEPAPTISLIEVYGSRRISRAAILKAAGIRVGDNLENIDQTEVIKRLESLPGIEKAAIAGIYGRLLRDDQLGMVLYLGLEEAGAERPFFTSEPGLACVLPAEIIDANDKEQAAFEQAAKQGEFGEDRSQGYSLANNPEWRAAQEQFIPLADAHWDALVEVLHHARDATQRSVAAKVIDYSSDKAAAARELGDAMRDPAPSVRNNATRALSAIFGYAKSHPELSISASPELVTQLVAMLNSLEWTDRNKAISLLLEIDDSDEVINELRRGAVPSLVEMANWETTHGAMAFMLLGRLVDLPHDESRLLWRQGKQASVIARIQETLP